MELSEIARLPFDQRMEQRAKRRASPEYQSELKRRIDAIRTRRRHEDIWRAIHASEKKR